MASALGPWYTAYLSRWKGEPPAGSIAGNQDSAMAEALTASARC